MELTGEQIGAGVSLILVDNTPGRGPDLHRHPYEEISVVHEGKATFTLGDAERDVSPGGVVVAPAGTPHKFVNSGTARLKLTAIHHAPSFQTEWL